MRSFVFTPTRSVRPSRTFDTVIIETPAAAATSSKVAGFKDFLLVPEPCVVVAVSGPSGFLPILRGVLGVLVALFMLFFQLDVRTSGSLSVPDPRLQRS